MIGGDGADTLVGGEGADYLEGGVGADTYFFNPGDGARNAQGQTEAVIETGADTTFVFGGGITGQSVTARKAGTTNNLSVFYGSVDAFLVTNGMSLGGATFRFSDGMTATLDDMLNAGLAGSSGSDSISGYDNRNDVIDGGAGNDRISGGSGDDLLLGGAGNDKLFAGAGNDVLRGEDGDDELNGYLGSDILDGGPGNDALIGGNGAMTYRFGAGSGRDYIVNSPTDGVNANDIVELAAGLTPSNVTVQRKQSSSNLFLTIDGTTDVLEVVDYFSYATTKSVVGIRFANGTIWDVNTVKSKVLLPTGGDDYLVGFSTAVVINGGDGNDAISGSAYDDLAFYKIPPAQVIVLHDELDLPLGKLRIKRGGGANGHNGLKDIDQMVGGDYWRIRLGIGPPGDKARVHDHVLTRFGAQEQPQVEKLLTALAEHLALFWQKSPEMLATKVAHALQPPKTKKEATHVEANASA